MSRYTGNTDGQSDQLCDDHGRDRDRDHGGP